MFTWRVHKVPLFVLGALECLCFGGWIFGWASLVFVLKQEGYFANKCQVGTTVEPVGSTFSDNATNEIQTAGPEPAMYCSDQDAELQLVFTVATFCVSGAALPLGLLYDRLGTIFMRVVISVLMLGGSLMFALSSYHHVLIFPAAVCVSAGGVQLLVVNLQISNLFGRSKWIVMTILCGCFDSSAWVFLVVKVLYESFSIPIQTTFLVLLGTTLFFTFNTCLLPKKTTIPWPLPADYLSNQKTGVFSGRGAEPLHVYSNTITDTEGRYYPKHGDGDEIQEEFKRADGDEKQKETIGKDVMTVEENGQEVLEHPHGNGSPPTCAETAAADYAIASPSNQQINPFTRDFPSLRACVMSPIFVFFYIWFSILQLDVLFFVSTLNPLLTRLAENDEQVVSSYTNALAFIQLGGILCSPFSGLILSRNKRRNRCKNREKEKERLRQRGPYSDLKDAALAYAVCTTIGLLFCTCGIMPVLQVQFATFALSVITRSFVYSLTASGTSLIFPMQYFGTLYGSLVLLSAVFSLLQYPLFIVTQKLLNDNDFWVKIGLLSATLLTYSFPIYIFFYSRRKERDFKQEDQSTVPTTIETS